MTVLMFFVGVFIGWLIFGLTEYIEDRNMKKRKQREIERFYHLDGGKKKK